MFNDKRIIPALQLHNDKLVKTLNFRNPVYVGDPLNIISIFNELEVDEILVNQISINGKSHEPNFDLLQRIGSQSLAPLTYGGGIRNLESAKRIIDLGFEKIVFSSGFSANPNLVAEAIKTLGSQAVIISLDIEEVEGNYLLKLNGGQDFSHLSLDGAFDLLRELNAGEILINNVTRDGTRSGFNLNLFRHCKSRVNQPLIAMGGAGNYDDLAMALEIVDAVAASSLFIFKSDRNNQLVHYPSAFEKKKLVPSLRVYKNLEDKFDFGDSVFVEKKSLGSSRIVYCKRCIINNVVPGSNLDNAEICMYCLLHDKLDNDYPNDNRGATKFDEYIELIKKDGEGSEYDCILGVSGGADSSYLAHILSERGVRILAVHFDNTWNSPIATSNIYKLTTKLDIDLETYVVDNFEYDDIYKAFLKSGVKDLEAPTDIGFISVLYRLAARHKIRHIVEGHSFRTEGVSPIGWLYMDGGYVKSVHKKYGTMKMKTFPNMSFLNFVYWTAFLNLKRARPLYWLDYSKTDARELLKQKYDWEWYGGHHLENRFTAFYHSYFLPFRFNIDFRQIEFSALVRSGFMQRKDALEIFNQPREISSSLLNYVKSRLDISEAEFRVLMEIPEKNFTEFKTYKRYFKLSKPLFYILLKLNRVPLSFYEKFCN